jgi:MFS family permease
MRKRHVVLGLLVALSVITYLDRVCIAVAGPRMQAQLGISPQQWGWVLGVFLISYGLFEVPTGAWGDRFGRRGVLTRIVAWWSAFTCLTGLASGFGMLVTVRLLFGAGEAGAYPNIAGVLGRWFPPTERARGQGFVWGASRLGGALSPLLVVPLMGRLGWRWPFFIFGAVGFAWAVVWYGWFRDRPAEQPGMTPEELAEIGLGATAGHADISWARLLRSGQLWLIMAMFGFYVWGSIFYLSWMPTYLVKGRGMSEGQMKVISALPFVLGMVGNLAGGFLSDALVRRRGIAFGRRAVGCASLAAASLLLAATALTRSNGLATVYLALGFGVMDCMLPCAWAVCADVGRSHAGSVSGAMNTAGQAGGFVCTVLFGHLAARYGYKVPLLVIAAMVMVSAALFALIDPTRPLVPEGEGPRGFEVISKDEAACV